MPRYSDVERKRVQRGLLPSPLLAGGRLACTTYYRSAADDGGLGGDFLDVVERPDGSVRAVIGDVMGHGPEEAGMGVQMRVAWRTLVLSGIPDDSVLPVLNRLYLAESGGATVIGFVTVCDLTLTPAATAGWRGQVRLAGHPSPITRSPKDATQLQAPVGPPLGLDERALGAAPVWPVHEFELTPHDALLLYTDGLLDAYATPDDLGEVGLVRAAAAHSAADKSEGDWMLDLLDYAPHRVQDDIAAVVMSPTTR